MGRLIGAESISDCATSVEDKLWNSFLEFIFSVIWLIVALALYCIENIINLF
jgi:hypothetical protein